MKYLDINPAQMGAEDAEDAQTATEALKQKMARLERELIELPPGYTPTQRADVLLEQGYVALELQQMFDAWQVAREAFDIYAEAERWEEAVQACNIMFASEEPDALVALGNGIWLAVTFPIDPELSVAMLQHLVNETPNDADGGAVAAAAAHYVADLRCEGQMRENLLFFTNQLLGQVARRHSDINDQASFDAWVERLELNNPSVFLPRLGQVAEVLVQSDWWIDRDALRAKLPQ